MDRPRSSTHGEQLSLFPAEAERAALPWGGKSPRVLTAAYVRFTLKAQAAKSTSDFVDPEQYDFWLPSPKAPEIYSGAPLLVSLPRRL